MYFIKTIGVLSFSPFVFRSNIGLALFLCFLPSVKAQEYRDTPRPSDYRDVLHPYASLSFRYDSNVFGLPDEHAVRSLGLDSLSDSSRVTRAGIRINKEISRQLLSADVSVNSLRFDRYAFLDTDGRDLKANWNWHVGKTLEGDIGANATRGLATFVNFNQPIKNVISQNNRYASLAWRPHPRWQAAVRYTASGTEYELPEIALSKRTEKKTTLEVNYLTPSSNTFGIQASYTSGNIPTSVLGEVQLGKDSFVQNTIKAKINWHLTNKTQVNLLVGPANRHENRATGDYKGTDIRVGATYQYSVKTNLVVAFWQEVGIVDDYTTLYSRNRGISVAPSWKITEKTSLVTELRREHRDFSESAAGIGQNGQLLNYTINTASLNMSYQMSNRILIQPSIFLQSKQGSMDANSFIRRGSFVTLQYQY